MKIFWFIFAFLAIVNAQVELSGGVDSNGSGANVSGGINVVPGPDQGQNSGQNPSSLNGHTNGPGYVPSGQGQGDIGDIFNGLSKGFGEFIKGFSAPIKTVGQTFCYGILQGINQVLRAEDFIGSTFSVSVNGKAVYNGTVQSDGSLKSDNNGGNNNGGNNNGGNNNGGNNNGSNATNVTKRHHHGKHHEEAKRALNLFDKLKGDKGGYGDKGYYGKDDPKQDPKGGSQKGGKPGCKKHGVTHQNGEVH